MNLPIRNFTCFLLLSVTWQAVCWPKTVTGEESGENDRPNILFIAVDDLRPELRFLGIDDAITPCMDQFSRESVTFLNHLVQVPTCGASRYALLTGRSPGQSKAFGNNAFFQGKSKLTADHTGPAQTFPELFRRNGYRTVCIGKISHTADGKVFAYNGEGDGRAEVPHAWDELATPYGTWKRGWGTFFAYHAGRHREDGKGNRQLMEFVAESDDELPDGMMATAAIEKLRELGKNRSDNDQPFLMGLGFYKPHLPWVATRQDWDAFENIEIRLPAEFGKPLSSFWHRSGEFYKYQMPFEKTRPLAERDRITARRAYLACVRYVDRQIGRVLKSLHEQGLAENTIVVLWGDHGWHLGESAIWGKHSPFDRSLNSVLMIRAPGQSLAGHQSMQLVESIDIYPTLVELARLKERTTRHDHDGLSLVDLLQGSDQPVRMVSLSWFSGGFTARTLNHRYVAKGRQVPQEKEQWDAIEHQELYDVKNSMDPKRNLLPETKEPLEFIIQELNSKARKDPVK